MLATETSHRKSFFSSFRKQTPAADTMNFWEHIEAFRWHIIRSIIACLTASTIIFIYIDWVYDHLILAPARYDFYTYGALCNLGQALHLGNTLCMPSMNIDLQVNTVNGTFSSALNIAVMGGIICAFPYICWELWRFIKPALSLKQKKMGTAAIFWISLCFFLGGLFGYYLLAPFTFNFLSNYSLGKTGMVFYRPSINDYVGTLTNLILGCGLAFELPVLTVVLTRIGIINGKLLRSYSKFAIVIIIAVAAIITPSPDWISQLIVSIPLFILYGISILLASRVERKRSAEV
ncbi:twin-arginine translocase subunit TatC [Ferruginibacter albus]|uniref:twin-arginine translocase subunit TatC n=1 Tax=Ferruginibacter albus TaxID=2875540 RepID=UPI001CC6DC42|nr:twin-arginine translocase subunit TatC [Ferruginibacter albus]UAY51275.1 twin-arginine translocase subunit TatC [Ferruginibacter albus]